MSIANQRRGPLRTAGTPKQSRRKVADRERENRRVGNGDNRASGDLQFEVGVGTAITERFPAERIELSPRDTESIDKAAKKVWCFRARWILRMRGPPVCDAPYREISHLPNDRYGSWLCENHCSGLTVFFWVPC